MSRLVVKNWRVFQHYKDRSPPWIKLQKSLLDDYEFACLPLASKALAPFIWLLASESDDGSIPADVAHLAFRLRWPEKDIAAGLKPLIDRGFLIGASNVLADCKQSATSEAETEVEKETETEGARKRASRRAPEDWKPGEGEIAWAASECPGVDLVAETRKFKDHTFATARTDWPATWRNWIRRATPTKPVRQPKAEPTPEQVSEARRQAAEANKRELERKVGPLLRAI